MSAAIVLASLVPVSMLVAAVRPGPALSLAATLICILATALHLPVPGLGGFGLVVAAGLALAASTLPRHSARALLLLALLWSLPAALLPASQPPAAPTALLASGLAATVALLAVAVLAGHLATESRRIERTWAAALLALAPTGSGGPLLPLGVAIELPLADGTGAWLQADHLVFSSASLAPWAPILWRFMPAILLAFVLCCAGLRRPTMGHIATAAVAILIAAVALAWWPLASAFVDGDATGLVASGHPFGGAPRTMHGAPGVDASPLLALLARLATLWLLVRSAAGVDHTSTASFTASGRPMQALTLGIGGLLLLCWSIWAPAWAGSAWYLDPAAMAAVAAFACGFGVLSAAGRGADGGAWRILQAAAALLILAGGQVGWRVASGLMLD